MLQIKNKRSVYTIDSTLPNTSCESSVVYCTDRLVSVLSSKVIE